MDASKSKQTTTEKNEELEDNLIKLQHNYTCLQVGTGIYKMWKCKIVQLLPLSFSLTGQQSSNNKNSND